MFASMCWPEQVGPARPARFPHPLSGMTERPILSRTIRGVCPTAGQIIPDGLGLYAQLAIAGFTMVATERN